MIQSILARSSRADAVNCVSESLRTVLFDSMEGRSLALTEELGETILAVKLIGDNTQPSSAAAAAYSKLIRDVESVVQGEKEEEEIPTMEFVGAMNVIVNLYGGNLDQQIYAQVQSKVEEWLPISTHTDLSEYIKNIENTFIDWRDADKQKFFVYFADICVSYAIASTKKIG